jgi:hypothetical protein
MRVGACLGHPKGDPFRTRFGDGDLVRRYRQGVEQLDALRQRLPQPYFALLFQQRQLREIRGVLNDLHKMVRAVSKGLEKW